ncbi:hypothetical protein BC937DRAFT_95627 [Endogone sp. FLAS-F59071]|nr:hypothetical protein BC937DRAFT_95627 [Endogone sp. FLAS-F59071]|eukprot:RUS13246.1 hypothetical protein BC937DRAFT_95627 [Endogone sp. FLAS-F59071]
MYSHYDALLSVFELVPVVGVLDESKKDSGSLSRAEETPAYRDNARPDILSQLGPSARRIVESVQEYLNIYDQEYLLKETIQSIVTPAPMTNSSTPSRFYTTQHGLAFLALWDVQPYLDVETMERIQERLNEGLGGKD